MGQVVDKYALKCIHTKDKIVAARRMVWEGHVALMRHLLGKVKEDHSEELNVYGMIILKWVGEWELD